jgi:hypothetical protein
MVMRGSGIPAITIAAALIAAVSSKAADVVLTNSSPRLVDGPDAGLSLPWSAELGTGLLFSNIRVAHLDSYTLMPIELTLTRSFDKVFADSRFEGTPEALVRAYHTVVLHGIESRLDGFSLGGRYSFDRVTPNLIPFVEATGGIAFTDSRQVTLDGHDRGLGQDFNFNFTFALGLRYDITERWFTRISALYSHYSNAGLSEPERSNRQIDAFGPVLTVGLRF